MDLAGAGLLNLMGEGVAGGGDITRVVGFRGGGGGALFLFGGLSWGSSSA